jgi:Flp pilus assembly pilin Flp
MIQHLLMQLRAANKNQEGTTTVEYAIMLGLVALAIALATPGLKDAVLGVFTSTSNALDALK